MILLEGCPKAWDGVERYLIDKIGHYDIHSTRWKDDVAALERHGIRAISVDDLWIELHFSCEYEEMMYRLKYL